MYVFDARRVLVSKINRPPHVESRRARVIVDAGGKKLLTVCVRCHRENYILEDHTTCSDCRPKHKSRRWHAPEITAPRFGRQSWTSGKLIRKLFHRQKGGQFEAESVLGDGQLRTGGIPLDDIVRSGTVRNFDVRNRSRTRL